MLSATATMMAAAAVLQVVVGPPLSNKPPTGYVDFYPGTGLNVILSAPHDGTAEPLVIPNRDAGCWDGNQCIWTHTCGEEDYERCSVTLVRDWRTADLTLELHQALCVRFSACPVTVISRLSRVKLDPNREINEATFNNPLAVDVYNEYHGYIAQERANMNGPGLYIDMHGHGHTIQRAELGYLVSGSDLDSGNSIDPDTTSIRGLYGRVGGNFDDLLRGATSFGAMLEAGNYDAVPSPSDPGPDGNLYFSGGYCTRTYSSVNGGIIDGIQIESPATYLQLPERNGYVDALVDAIEAFLATHSY